MEIQFERFLNWVNYSINTVSKVKCRYMTSFGPWNRVGPSSIALYLTLVLFGNPLNETAYVATE